MKPIRQHTHAVIVLVCLLLLPSVPAQVPQMIHYQGRVTVGGTNVTGNYNFRFALVNTTGAVTYWSNGTAAVSLSVNKGLYSVLLGDTNVPNMAALSASVFTNSDVRLRVWFDPGSGLQQLGPDQRISAVGFALQAERAYQAATADDAMHASVATLAYNVLATNGTVTTQNLALENEGGAWLFSGSSNELAIAYGETAPSKVKSDAKTLGFPLLAVQKLVDLGIWVFKHSGIIKADGFECDGDMLVKGTLRVGLDHQAATGAAIVGGTNNTASGFNSFIGGGRFHNAGGEMSFIGGGASNIAIGVGGFVGGGANNNARGDASFVGGGSDNTANGNASFIAGGANNSAAGDISFIGAGLCNTAAVPMSVVAGGEHNTAAGMFAVVGGGSWNIAAAQGAVVPGGEMNIASGEYSFAAGRRAYAVHSNCFVWGGSVAGGHDTYSAGHYTFTVRAPGGAYFYSFADGTTNGVYLAPGGGGWSPLSDRAAKENFQAVDCRSILQRLAAVPIATWNYKTQSPSIRHIGPVAQDFYATFGVGEDNRHINTVDADGVALAAIKGLYEELQTEKARNAALERRLTELERLVKGGN